MDKDLKKMTLDEIDEALEKRYGKDWLDAEIDDNDELFKEFIERISCGENEKD